MDTHDEMNKERAQEEVSSDFKSGPITQGSGAQSTSDVSSKESTAGFWNRKESNPYRLTQTSEKGPQNQQFEMESFESSARSGFIQQIKEKLFSQGPGQGNAKQKAMIVLVPILAIAFIFVLRQVFSKAPAKTNATTNDNMSVVISAANSNDDIDWQIPEPLPVVLRDPAKTGNQANYNNIEQDSGETQLGDMTVRGILYSDDKPSVVIGRKIVHLDEKINDITVVEINKDYVVFEKDGKRWARKVAESEPIQKINYQEEIK
jgi:hypothetical protein